MQHSNHKLYQAQLSINQRFPQMLTKANDNSVSSLSVTH